MNYPVVLDAFPFNPDLWSQDQALLNYANCQTYMMGDTGLVLLQVAKHCGPGGLCQKELRSCKLSKIVSFNNQDGLKYTGNEIRIMPGSYPVALLYRADGRDYHWIRMNRDGTWSHKFPGDPPELLLCDNGDPIRDIAKLFRLNGNPCAQKKIYYFVAYYNVPIKLNLSWKRNGKAPDRLRSKADKGDYLKFGNLVFNIRKMYREIRPKRKELKRKWDTGLPIIIPAG